MVAIIHQAPEVEPPELNGTFILAPGIPPAWSNSMPMRPRRFAAPTPVATRSSDKAERDKFYTGPAWRRVRDVQLATDPLCTRCLANDILTPATIAHHILERLARPDLALDPRNLESLCPSCHTALHKRKLRDADD